MKKIIFIIAMVSLLLVSACSGPQTQDTKMTGNVIQTVSESRESEQKMVSLEELSLHNYKTDCYVAVEGKVYDITRWIARETDKLESKDREELPEPYNDIEEMQRFIVRHCGTASEFETEFDRTTLSENKAHLFAEENFIGLLE